MNYRKQADIIFQDAFEELYMKSPIPQIYSEKNEVSARISVQPKIVTCVPRKFQSPTPQALKTGFGGSIKTNNTILNTDIGDKNYAIDKLGNLTPSESQDDISYSDTENEVVRPVKVPNYTKTYGLGAPPVQKTVQNETTLHLWIIKPIPQFEGICVEGKKNLEDEEFWHSSLITKRISSTCVETNTGSRYRLIGDLIECDAIAAGISQKLVNAFYEGFPEEWVDLVKEFYSSIPVVELDDLECFEQPQSHLPEHQKSQQEMITGIDSATETVRKQNISNLKDKCEKKLSFAQTKSKFSKPDIRVHKETAKQSKKNIRSLSSDGNFESDHSIPQKPVVNNTKNKFFKPVIKAQPKITKQNKRNTCSSESDENFEIDCNIHQKQVTTHSENEYSRLDKKSHTSRTMQNKGKICSSESDEDLSQGKNLEKGRHVTQKSSVGHKKNKFSKIDVRVHKKVNKQTKSRSCSSESDESLSQDENSVPNEKENSSENLPSKTSNKTNTSTKSRTAQKNIPAASVESTQVKQVIRRTRQSRAREKNPSKEKTVKKNITNSVKKMAEIDREQECEVNSKNDIAVQKTIIDLFSWIIRPLVHLEGICVEGKKPGCDEFWHSSVICEIIDEKHVKTNSGTIYRLNGKMEKEDALDAGMSQIMVKTFQNGFPKDWKDLVERFYKQKKRKFMYERRFPSKRKPPLSINTIPRNEQQTFVLSQWFSPRKKKTLAKNRTEDAGISLDTSVCTSSGQLVDYTKLQKTRSGRFVKPQLAWWAGQKIDVDPANDSVMLTHRTSHAEEVLKEMAENVLNSVKRNTKTGTSFIKNKNKTIQDEENQTSTKYDSIVENKESDVMSPPKRIRGDRQSKILEATESPQTNRTKNLRAKCQTKGVRVSLEKIDYVVEEYKKITSNDKGNSKLASEKNDIRSDKCVDRTIKPSEEKASPVNKDSSGRQLRKKNSVKSGVSIVQKDSSERQLRRTKSVNYKELTETEIKKVTKTTKSEPETVAPNHNIPVTKNKVSKRTNPEDCEDFVSVSKSAPPQKRFRTNVPATNSGSINGLSAMPEKKQENVFINKVKEAKKTDLSVKNRVSNEEWSEAEIQKFFQALEKQKNYKQIKWKNISTFVGSRSTEECKVFHAKQKKITKKDAPKITAKVGTLKRKQQLRDIFDDYNDGYQDLITDATPFKAKQKEFAKSSKALDSSVFSEYALGQSLSVSKLKTPSTHFTKRNEIPNTNKKTPTVVKSPWPGQTNWKDNDQYINNLKKNRKNVKSKASQPIKSAAKSSKLTSSPNIGNLLRNKKDNSSDDEDSEEENDYYWSDESD